MTRPKQNKTHAGHAAEKRKPPRPERVVPPPRSETEPELPLTEPSSYTRNAGLVTQYPDRSEYEAQISARARELIHEGKRPKRTRGPTTEAS